MDLLRTIFSRIAALFRRRRLDADLDEELRAHIDLAVEENIQRGMSAAAARTAALRDFGGLTQTREQYRLQRGIGFLETTAQDIRYSLRQLRNSPGFALTAILTLALGIGANTAIFTLVQGVLLAPLPYPQPQRLVLLQQSRPTTAHLDLSLPDFEDWQRTSHSFERVAAFTWRESNLTGSGPSEHLPGMEVSSGFFATLGVKPALGREISASEDQPHGAPVALIGDHLWRDRFAASPGVLGKSIAIDGVDTTIIGVLPPGFRFWTDADIYTSLAQGVLPAFVNDRTVHGFLGIGRLQPRVTVAHAQSEMSSIQQNLDRLYPSADRTLDSLLVPLKEAFVGDVRSTLLLLLSAVGVVLLIACTNVASLLLARSATRGREFAIRKALGAGRKRIVQQLLTECVLLALTAGLLGVGLAVLCVRLVLIAFPDSLPRTQNIAIHLPVLLFALAVSLAVGILFGLVPAFKSSRVPLQVSLKAGERGSTRVHQRGQKFMVVFQMALTVVLLAGSGLLLRTIHRLWTVDPGFDANRVIAFKVGFSPSLTGTPQSTRLAFQRLLDRLRRIPGVEAADATNIVPLTDDDNGGPFWLGTTAPASPQDAPHALYFWTGPDYLNTMRIPLLRGRYFTAADTTASQKVIVIDNDLAQRYFPGSEAVGRTIAVPHFGVTRVIGVVGHVKHWGLNDPGIYNPSQIYISIYQLQDNFTAILPSYLNLLVRTPLDEATLMPAIRGAVESSGADQPVYKVKTLEEIVTDSLAPERLPMMLLAAFASLALLLASVGIYGAISCSVADRTKEMGIRMALGAEHRDLMRMVVLEGLRLALIGLAIGVACALLLTRALSSFSHLLYGVDSSDPLTFAAVSLVLIAAALLACSVPALRAMRVNPMQVLRAE
jgi:predicted permease